MQPRRKRYVLVSTGLLSEDDRRSFLRFVGQRYGSLKVIELKGHPDMLILKTDVQGAAAIRESVSEIKAGNQRPKTLLISGSIVNLKRRAAET